MWNLKRNATNELRKQTDSQTQRTKLRVPWRRVGAMGIQGVWNGHVHTAIFKMDNSHYTLCHVAAWMGGGFGGEQIYVYV